MKQKREEKNEENTNLCALFSSILIIASVLIGDYDIYLLLCKLMNETYTHKENKSIFYMIFVR